MKNKENTKMKESQNVEMEGGLIDTALHLNMPSPTAAIFYMDFTQTEDQMETSSEDFPMSRLDLKMFTRHVQAEQFRVSADMTEEQLNDMLAYHNINGIEALYPTLCDEMRLGIEKRLYQKYVELGIANAESKKSNWLKWIEKMFKTSLPSYSESIASRLLVLSNRIGADGHLGQANFAIVSRLMLTEIENDPRYVFAKSRDSMSTTGYTLVGHLPNIEIYVSNLDQWDSEQIVIGRTPREKEPGVYYCEYENEFIKVTDEMSIHSGSPRTRVVRDHKCLLVSRHAIVGVGNNPSVFYYAENLRIGKKPWWRKLFKL